MTLSAPIRKRTTVNLATVIPAISATQQAEISGTVARIETIAVATPTEGKATILSTMRDVDLPEPESDTRHFRWLIHYQDCDPVEATFLPEHDHAGVLTWHPDAIAEEPVHNSKKPMRRSCAMLFENYQEKVGSWV